MTAKDIELNHVYRVQWDKNGTYYYNVYTNKTKLSFRGYCFMQDKTLCSEECSVLIRGIENIHFIEDLGTLENYQNYYPELFI